jgi:alkanesulfonate monooxygenase SsuD/methylene tetrahydromethanopterin reductase-like flavin-dependent oxidoreductase (luciferase family)
LADETLGALQALWRGEDGYTVSLLQITGGIAPSSWHADGIPILVGGSIRRSAERAARFGIGYHASTSYAIGHIESQVAHVHSAWGRIRPTSAPPAIHANRLTIIAETDEEATTLGRRWAGAILRHYNRGGSLHRLGLPDFDAAAIFDQLRDDFCIVGTPDAAAAQIKRYAAIGVTHLDLRVAPAGMPAGVAGRTIRLLRESAVLSPSAAGHG